MKLSRYFYIAAITGIVIALASANAALGSEATSLRLDGVSKINVRTSGTSYERRETTTLSQSTVANKLTELGAGVDSSEVGVIAFTLPSGNVLKMYFLASDTRVVASKAEVASQIAITAPAYPQVETEEELEQFRLLMSEFLQVVEAANLVNEKVAITNSDMFTAYELLTSPAGATINERAYVPNGIGIGINTSKPSTASNPHRIHVTGGYSRTELSPLAKGTSLTFYNQGGSAIGLGITHDSRPFLTILNVADLEQSNIHFGY